MGTVHVNVLMLVWLHRDEDLHSMLNYPTSRSWMGRKQSATSKLLATMQEGVVHPYPIFLGGLDNR